MLLFFRELDVSTPPLEGASFQSTASSSIDLTTPYYNTILNGQLNVLYFNARSLSPKLDELRVLCDFNKPEIVCITEIWLCDDISLTECSTSVYNSIRCDRHRHGGGVAFFVSEQLDYHVILCGPNQLELLLISVSRMNHPNNKFHVGVWYRPPDNREELDTLFLILQSIDISIFFKIFVDW